MSTKYPSQRLKVDAAAADEIKSHLIQQGGVEDKDIKSEHEVWRVRFSNTTLTYYKSGTLFCTASSDPSSKRFLENLKKLVE
jgi:ribonuclease HIII